MFFATKGNVTLSQPVTQMKLHVFVYFSYSPVYNVLHLVDIFLCMLLHSSSNIIKMHFHVCHPNIGWRIVILGTSNINEQGLCVFLCVHVHLPTQNS